MKIVYDVEDPAWYWLSENTQDFCKFESYCLLIGVEVNYSPLEYGISAISFEKGKQFPDYFHLELLKEEEQPLLEFAKIQNEKIEILSYRYGDDDNQQGKSFYPYQPTDGGRMFGEDS